MNRNDRRRYKRQIEGLHAEVARLETEIRSGEMEISAARERSAELVASVHAKIEEYVGSLASVASIDEASVAEPEQAIFERLVEWRWHGVKDVQQAKHELFHEVARRSVGKADLALLLSSVDHTAESMLIVMSKTPEEFDRLSDDEIAGKIQRELAEEGLSTNMMSDERFTVMRERWIKLGWRGATAETFNDTFLKAAAERAAGVRVHGPTRDTILDSKLNRESQAVREEMTEGFRKRLEREYAALPGSLECTPAIDMEGQEIPTVGVEATLSEARDALPVLGPNERFSDHAIMRFGRIGWEETFAKGMNDEQLREQVSSRLKPDEPTDAALSMFTAKWAVHAFQRLMTSHTFAAALMCSDVQREVLNGIEKQWDAFLVIVPNGMLVSDGLEVSRIAMASYSFGVQILLIAPVPSGQVRMVLDQAPDLPSLLVSDGSDLEAVTATHRCLIMAKRLVAGLLLNLQHPSNVKVRKVEARAESKHREAEPEHRIVTIGAPLEIDCRAHVKDYIENGRGKGRKRGPPTVQVMVRGHFRNQPYGPRHSLRRSQWIKPHWWGPEAALIQTRPKVPT